MNNNEIIKEIAISLYGEEAVSKMEESGEDIPLHTTKGWTSIGPYKVRKGEHGIQTKLWKRRKQTDSVDAEDAYYLAKAYLFSREQIEEVVK